ncbi:hypothetical protein ACFL5V_07955 [Fibrobacterota bacterium]
MNNYHMQVLNFLHIIAGYDKGFLRNSPEPASTHAAKPECDATVVISVLDGPYYVFGVSAAGNTCY